MHFCCAYLINELFLSSCEICGNFPSCIFISLCTPRLWSLLRVLRDHFLLDPRFHPSSRLIFVQPIERIMRLIRFSLSDRQQSRGNVLSSHVVFLVEVEIQPLCAPARAHSFSEKRVAMDDVLPFILTLPCSLAELSFHPNHL